MKLILRCTKNQLYLLYKQPYFWISMFIVGIYSIANIIYYGMKYYGYSKLGIITVSDMYIFSNNNVFWGIFSLLIPFICMLPFGMQPLNDRENGTEIYFLNRINKKMYYISGALCSAIGTFFVTCFYACMSTIFLYFMFDENGNTLQGTKYSVEYWLNIQSGYRYHFQNIHIFYPLIYITLVTILFSLFCSVFAVFFYSIATMIKKDKIHMILVPGFFSFSISQLYLATGYDIYGDLTASTVGSQNGSFTVALIIIMVLTSVFILNGKIKYNDNN